MNNLNKHRVDEIFIAGLNIPDRSEVDEDWALMKARLQTGRNRSRVPYYLIFASLVAEAVLLVLSVFFNALDNIQEGSGSSANDKNNGNPGVADPANGTIPKSIPVPGLSNAGAGLIGFVSPYLKLPLTELGYGYSRLRSAGVSVGVVTEFNKSKK